MSTEAVLAAITVVEVAVLFLVLLRLMRKHETRLAEILTREVEDVEELLHTGERKDRTPEQRQPVGRDRRGWPFA